MQKLNLPVFNLKLRQHEGKKQVFDILRKKYVALTPEEWVRQNLLAFLIDCHSYPPGLMAVEMPVKVNGLNQRADVVVYNRKGKPVMIIECKAPSVKLSKTVFDQAARYNISLQVGYMMVSNGMQHYVARLNSDEGSYSMLSAIPAVEELMQTD